VIVSKKMWATSVSSRWRGYARPKIRGALCPLLPWEETSFWAPISSECAFEDSKKPEFALAQFCYPCVIHPLWLNPDHLSGGRMLARHM